MSCFGKNRAENARDLNGVWRAAKSFSWVPLRNQGAIVLVWRREKGPREREDERVRLKREKLATLSPSARRCVRGARLNLAALDLITEIPADTRYDPFLHPWARNANYLPCTRRTQKREATFLPANETALCG